VRCLDEDEDVDGSIDSMFYANGMDVWMDTYAMVTISIQVLVD
jgi:hypothetical protein